MKKKILSFLIAGIMLTGSWLNAACFAAPNHHRPNAVHREQPKKHKIQKKAPKRVGKSNLKHQDKKQFKKFHKNKKQMVKRHQKQYKKFQRRSSKRHFRR